MYLDTIFLTSFAMFVGPVYWRVIPHCPAFPPRPKEPELLEFYHATQLANNLTDGVMIWMMRLNVDGWVEV